MDAKTSLFAAVSIKPQGINELIDRLPYSQHSVYHAVSLLKNEGMIVKTYRQNKRVLDVADGYTPQKTREIYIQALTHGVDPQILMRDSTLKVWNSLGKAHTLKKIKKQLNRIDNCHKDCPLIDVCDLMEDHNYVDLCSYIGGLT